MKSIDVFISGGGIAGFITGILLARLNLSVVIADPHIASTSLHKSTRTSALMEESLGVLKTAGIYDGILKNSEDLKSLSISDISLPGSAPVTHMFHASEIGQNRFGRNIVNHDLLMAAINLAKDCKNIFHLSTSINSIQPNASNIKITTNDGQIFSAKLLIGADGRASKVRELCGIKTWSHDYKQTAITGVIAHTKPHLNVSKEFHRDGGPFTLVPLPQNKSSFVWMDPHDKAGKILKLNRDEFVTALQNQTHNILGTITLISPPESFPILVLKSETLIAQRVALVAEAAHVLSPIGAQGLNLSLRDIDCLVQHITTQLSLGLDIGSQIMLKKYESDRKKDIDVRVHGTDILNRAVKFLPTPFKQIRRMSLKFAGDFAPLRHSLMQEGLRGINAG